MARSRLRISSWTPEALEAQLEQLLKPWRKRNERKRPITRKQWETALRLGGLNEASLTVLLYSPDRHQLTGLHGLLASLIPPPPAERNANDARDKWLYRRLQDSRNSLNAVLFEFKGIAKTKGWEPLGSIQGLRLAAKRYAARHNLPELAKRKRG